MFKISRLSRKNYTFDNVGIGVKLKINTLDITKQQKTGNMYRDAMGDIYINMDEGGDGMGHKRGLEKRNEGREESDAMAAKKRDESPEFG
ncbi:MAG: hypothetical protein LQ337_008087 [Flavoplaca oasis]|nr:MAG: hypothetical protein LQ337_008087 [Flavoplaca oasis]